jgi:hypothetical protein
MAKIIGWYKKRPGKSQIRVANVYCSEGFCTRELGPDGYRIIKIESNYMESDEPEAPIEHFDIELTVDEAVGLANQLLAAVKYARKS